MEEEITPPLLGADTVRPRGWWIRIHQKASPGEWVGTPPRRGLLCHARVSSCEADLLLAGVCSFVPGWTHTGFHQYSPIPLLCVLSTSLTHVCVCKRVPPAHP